MVKLTKLKGFASIGGTDYIGIGITGFFWFFLATLIEPEEFGELQYFLGIASIAFTVSMIGRQNTIMVYAAKNVKLISTLYILSVIITIISASTLMLIFDRLDVSLIIFSYVIGELSVSYLLGKKLFNKYPWYVITQKILVVVFGLGFFYLFGIEGIIFGLALSYVHYIKLFLNVLRDSPLDLKLVKPRIGFIVNNYVNGLIVGVKPQIGKIIIATLFGFALLGEFALSLQIFGVLMMFSGVAFKYLLPQDASGVQNKQLKKFIIIISIIISILGMTVLPLVLPAVFPKYTEVTNSIQILSIAVIPATLTMILTSQLLGNEKSKFILIGESIAFAIIVIGIIILGPIMKIEGLATTFVLAMSIQSVYLIILNRYQKSKGYLN